MFVQSLIGATVLAAVHVLANKIGFLHVRPRSRWLSIAGGVAVAYAIVHLLPELGHFHDVVSQSEAVKPFAAKRLVWLTCLAGLVTFYGLEKMAGGKVRADSTATSRREVFWLHIASYASYNGLLGYLLVREDRDAWSLVLFVVGIGLHFVVNDFALLEHHKESYRKQGRWLLAAAILFGWAVGVSTNIHEELTALVTAFLAGGILLNVFKEELPEERESRFWAFALGAGGYAAILVAA